MDTLTALLLVLITITATFGTMQLMFWCAEKERTERLAIFAACLGAVGFALFENGMAHAGRPEEFLWLQLHGRPFSVLAMIGTAWFLYISLKTGRRWLFWAIVSFQLLILVINYTLPHGLNWIQVNDMVPVTVFGERYYYPAGIRSPTTYLPTLGYILLLIFSLDTSIRAWRPGDRIRVGVHGFGVAIFSLASPVLATGILFGILHGPVFVAPAILFVIMATSFQMLLDMQRAAGLSGRLAESEAELTETLEQLNLSANAGEVGLWRRNFDEPHFRSSEKAKELFGFPTDAVVGPRDFLEHVHEDDVVRVIEAMKAIEIKGVEFEIEFRIRRPDGEVRWIYSHGDIIRGDPMIVRGASVDITERKAAEEEVHDLARKLINAQEKERGRLARDLHDHLSQSIALVSIHLGELKSHMTEPLYLEAQIGELRSQLQVLGSDVHRISHELHPAKLTQLGLEAALRGFCREISQARGLNVDFAAANLNTDLDDNLSLCFYRVAQEALQNIVKHADASRADVRVEVTGSELVLAISDDGKGFDIELASEKGSLGLVSISERMRAVAGTSNVLSSPGNGTTIEARAPLSSGGAVSST